MLHIKRSATGAITAFQYLRLNLHWRLQVKFCGDSVKGAKWLGLLYRKLKYAKAKSFEALWVEGRNHNCSCKNGSNSDSVPRRIYSVCILM